MIVDLIAEVLIGLVGMVVSLLPTSPVPPNLSGMVTSAYAAADGLMGLGGQWFPLGELAAALVVLLTFAGVVTAFRMLAWVLALIHIGGTDA